MLRFCAHNLFILWSVAQHKRFSAFGQDAHYDRRHATWIHRGRMRLRQFSAHVLAIESVCGMEKNKTTHGQWLMSNASHLFSSCQLPLSAHLVRECICYPGLGESQEGREHMAARIKGKNGPNQSLYENSREMRL